jgi:hypothetical protein
VSTRAQSALHLRDEDAEVGVARPGIHLRDEENPHYAAGANVSPTRTGPGRSTVA